MNKNPGVIGKKIGMTQIFDDKGEVLRCTVVHAPCIVIGKRTQEKDGYDALVLGLGDRKEKRTNKPLAGQFKKISQPPKQFVRELRSDAEHVSKFEIGQKLQRSIRSSRPVSSSTPRVGPAAAASPACFAAGAWPAA